MSARLRPQRRCRAARCRRGRSARRRRAPRPAGSSTSCSCPSPTGSRPIITTRAAHALAQQAGRAQPGDVGHGRPDAAPGIDSCAGAGHQAPHARPSARRRPRPRDRTGRASAVLVDDRALRDIDDLRAGDQPRRRTLQPAVQQVEQRAAPDAQSEGLGMQVGIARDRARVRPRRVLPSRPTTRAPCATAASARPSARSTASPVG